MKTYFSALKEYGLPKSQAAVFTVAGIRYEVIFTEITEENRYDCAAVLPEGNGWPHRGHHYDITFDSNDNKINRTPFQRVDKLPLGASCRVRRELERIVIDHYLTFNVIFYTFTAADFKLSRVYCRGVTLKKFRHFTLEVGHEPGGKANVLRTPRFYQ